MKLTNREISNAKEPLLKLMQVKLPVLVSYKLAKLAGALQDSLAIIEKLHDGLIHRYGTSDPKHPNQIRIEPNDKNFPKFAEELGVLLEQEVEVEFDVVELPLTIEIEPYVLLALETFVKLEAEVESK